MTESASPELLEALAENRANFQARSAELAEQEEREQREIREAAEERREANAAHNEKLNEQAAENKAAKEDPSAANQWLQRRDGGGQTMDFGPGADDEPEDPAGAPGVHSAGSADQRRTEQPAPPPASPRRRQGEDDDEDFADRDWFG